jgi:Fungal protein kinase
MSINVLMGRNYRHAPWDDLESFFYVLIFLCLEHSAPGRERKWDIYSTELRYWIEGNNLWFVGSVKGNGVQNPEIFHQLVLQNLPKYFEDVGPCLETLRAAFFSRRDATHDSIIAILNDRCQLGFDETIINDPLPATKSVTKSKRRRVKEQNEEDKERSGEEAQECGASRKRRRMRGSLREASSRRGPG